MRSLTFAALGCAVLLIGGCTNDVDEFLECAQICEGYDDCVGDSADATGCTDRCEDYADQSEAAEAQVFDCETCFEEMGDICDDRCNTRCDGIIPAPL